MALLPIGHLTGLRNTVTTGVVVGTLLWLGRDAWRGLPARALAVALLAWCAASIAWSAAPQVSFGKWRVDLLLPLLAYAAAFGYVRRSGRIDAIAGGTLTGIAGLALLCVPALLPDSLAALVGRSVRSESFATILHPMPVWFPGVGDASMAAALASVGAVLSGRAMTHVSRRMLIVAGLVFALLIVLILTAINNRNATITIPLTVLVAVWLDRRRGSPLPAAPARRSPSRRIVVGCLVVVVLAGSLALLESGARHRMLQMGVPVADDQSGLVLLTERDTRPMIWNYYARLALLHPWVGVGFGRTVPGLTYRTQDDTQLASIEANAYAHAHNLLLNWWLQTGVVGMALLLALLGTIVLRMGRSMGAAGTSVRAGASTVVALVITMLLRNMTDDFLIFGMATMFWVLVGSFAAVAYQSPAVGQREP